MASEAVGSNPSAIARLDAASGAGAEPPALALGAADALALGYEAADPALHAPQWNEAMQVASLSRR